MEKMLSLTLNDPRVVTLCKQDSRLGELIHCIGDLTTQLRTNYFDSLISSIIGQQLSVKAAATIRRRVIEAVPEFTPDTIYNTEDKVFRSAGVSLSKISYMKDLCLKVMQGEIHLEQLHLLEDEEVIKALTTVKGIGKWTAEMFLIFSLGRMNVLSFGDAGLQRAAQWLYELEERKDRKYLEQCAHKWEPYCTAASLYLWEAINQGYVDCGKSITDIKLMT
ncbi:DNA-3-methyladenine glycosylase 2 family protein [Paenibacillus sediminis]|uniref:DNA-3-methyladenine glycosylase II n=1 Tax=Paenibacillus sediminis TaxID=664909 RepID=A0ABS4H2J8_9BACL|nr:DNA-3-methyladenine glycosylase 2 family protein [Paenibacillus sediminis]MBP1936765.1 DNA-3-methyladenine glycosylase II [Paenibacillus sediminis]